MNKEEINLQDKEDDTTSIYELAYALGAVAARLYLQGKLTLDAEDTQGSVSDDTADAQPDALSLQNEVSSCSP